MNPRPAGLIVDNNGLSGALSLKIGYNVAIIVNNALSV